MSRFFGCAAWAVALTLTNTLAFAEEPGTDQAENFLPFENFISSHLDAVEEPQSDPDSTNAPSDVPQLANAPVPVFTDVPAPVVTDVPAPVFPGLLYQSSAQKPYLVPSSRKTFCDSDVCGNCRDESNPGPVRRYWRYHLKPKLQESHWGYRNHFKPRPFGDSVLTAFSRTIQRGSEDMMFLYDYDFFPTTTNQASRLTPRGLYQLTKMARRLEWTPAAIKVQRTSTDSQLDAARRQHVIEELKAMGIDTANVNVVSSRVKYSTPAEQAIETQNSLLNSIRSRGRTIQSRSIGGIGN